MAQKPYAAFGYVLIANTYEAGEIFDVTTTTETNTVLFFTKGVMLSKNKDTGEPLPSFQEGFFTGTHENMSYRNTAVTDCTWYCYDPNLNRAYLPPITKFALSSGDTTTVVNGTRLYLCRGTVNVDNKQITAPAQLQFSTGDKSVTAVGQVYGMVIQ